MRRFLKSLLLTAAFIVGALLGYALTSWTISYVQWSNVHCHETGGFHTVLMPFSTGKTVVLIPMQEPNQVCQ